MKRTKRLPRKKRAIQHTILPVFGGLGYFTHLVVDKAMARQRLSF